MTKNYKMEVNQKNKKWKTTKKIQNGRQPKKIKNVQICFRPKITKFISEPTFQIPYPRPSKLRIKNATFSKLI